MENALRPMALFQKDAWVSQIRERSSLGDADRNGWHTDLFKTQEPYLAPEELHIVNPLLRSLSSGWEELTTNN